VADRHNDAVQRVLEALHKQHTEHAVLVNAKLEFRPGRGHESYYLIKVRIIGDLYLRQIDTMPSQHRDPEQYEQQRPKKQQGLIQHGHAMRKS
jgi:hypothetical protein